MKEEKANNIHCLLWPQTEKMQTLSSCMENVTIVE